MELTRGDLRFVVARLPKDLVGLIKKHRLIVAGGFIRETIACGKVSDIDVFGTAENILDLAALELSQERKGRLFKTKNATTVLSPPRLPVQFVKRWLFADPVTCIESFDFTVCQAAIWFDGGKWFSVVSEGFYFDLAARRLVYTYPQRDEDAGGSMIRMKKFIQRGYSIQAESMAGVISRLVSRLKDVSLTDEKAVSKILVGLLREVDPLTVVDGVDLIDEHETLQEV